MTTTQIKEAISIYLGNCLMESDSALDRPEDIKAKQIIFNCATAVLKVMEMEEKDTFGTDYKENIGWNSCLKEIKKSLVNENR